MTNCSYNRSKKNPPTAILFLKIIVRASLADGKLMVPNNFTRKYGGDLSNPVFLKPPDGTEWKVYWTKLDGEIWFDKGWKEFATYYTLDHGHVVLFEYKETSHFEVHMLDLSGLEINYPFRGTQDEKDNLDLISDDPVEILDDLAPCQKTRHKSPMSSRPHKKLKTGTTAHVERRSNLQDLPYHVKSKGGYASPATSHLISRCLGMTRPLKEAKKFNSENPIFTIKIKQSYLGKTRPNLKFDFVRKYFEKMKKRIVMIQFGEKLWRVKVLYYPSRYAASFSGGWSRFAKESELQAGDVCIFELIDRKNAVLDVHIFRGHTIRQSIRSS